MKTVCRGDRRRYVRAFGGIAVGSGRRANQGDSGIGRPGHHVRRNIVGGPDRRPAKESSHDLELLLERIHVDAYAIKEALKKLPNL